MTVEEREAEDRKLILQIEDNLTEHRRLVNLAYSQGLQVWIQTRTIPEDSTGAMWPTLVSARREMVYRNLDRKGF